MVDCTTSLHGSDLEILGRRVSRRRNRMRGFFVRESEVDRRAAFDCCTSRFAFSPSFSPPSAAVFTVVSRGCTVFLNLRSTGEMAPRDPPAVRREGFASRG